MTGPKPTHQCESNQTTCPTAPTIGFTRFNFVISIPEWESLVIPPDNYELVMMVPKPWGFLPIMASETVADLCFDQAIQCIQTPILPDASHQYFIAPVLSDLEEPPIRNLVFWFVNKGEKGCP